MSALLRTRIVGSLESLHNREDSLPEPLVSASGRSSPADPNRADTPRPAPFAHTLEAA